MKRLKKIAPLFAAMLLAGSLYAQPSSLPAAPPAAPAVKTAPLSPERMKKEAQALRDDVRASIQHLYFLQTKARKSNDIIKLTCVNDKFIKLKAEANLFDEAHRDLLDGLDSDSRFANYDRVTASAHEVTKSREEAEACIGESQLESANEFEGPEIVDDPTLGLPFDIAVEPPAYASPYI